MRLRRRSNTEATASPERREAMRMPRSRGMVSGLLIALLGAWAALVPMIGSYFDFSIRDVSAWTWDTDVLFLSILPGAAALVGGLMLAATANRASGGAGGWIALAGGVWLLIGSSMWLIGDGFGYVDPAGTTALEQVAYFYGTGALITALSSFALGRLSIRGHRDPGVVDERPLADVERRRHRRETPADGSARDPEADVEAQPGTRTPG